MVRFLPLYRFLDPTTLQNCAARGIKSISFLESKIRTDKFLTQLWHRKVHSSRGSWNSHNRACRVPQVDNLCILLVFSANIKYCSRWATLILPRRISPNLFVCKLQGTGFVTNNSFLSFRNSFLQ